jgi:hypothetical protein
VVSATQTDRNTGAKMLVTLSERRLSERIRQLENIQDSIEEITFRMEHYAKRLFLHVNEFGLRFAAMVEQHGGLATIQLDISGVGRNWEDGDFAWSKLSEGLACLDPVAVSVEERDMAAICTGLIATMALDSWESYAAELQRISVSEIRPKIEAVLLRLHTQPREVVSYERTGIPEYDHQLQETEDIAQLERSGDPHAIALASSIRRQQEADARRQAEEAAFVEQEQARVQRVINGEF